MGRHKLKFAGVAIGTLALLLFLAYAGSILYVNAPEHADAILVLNGGTWARVATGLERLRQGWAPHLILEVDANAVDWQIPEGQLAQQWIARLPGNEREQATICPAGALSTRDDAKLTLPCLRNYHSILLVTSDYHTRRTLAIFRRVDPQHQFSVAGAHEPLYFGVHWWQHREWAKTTGQEWIKLLWWEAVDRWRH